MLWKLLYSVNGDKQRGHKMVTEKGNRKRGPSLLGHYTKCMIYWDTLFLKRIDKQTKKIIDKKSLNI